MPDKIVTAAILVIGNEVLSGRTQDANINWLAQELGKIGIRLREARVIPDDEAEIVAAVNALRARYDYVFTTGGIGPTHDDITSECVAKAFGVPLLRDPRALARLEGYYKPGDLNEMRLRMANIPEGAELIDNPISHAPGYRIGNVMVMAGVPRIMQAMFDGIRHTLAGGAVVKARTLTILLPEGRVAEGLARIQADYPAVEIGSYPFVRLDKLGTAIVLRDTDEARRDRAAQDVRDLVASLGGMCEEE